MMITCCSEENKQSDRDFKITAHFPHLPWLLRSQDSRIPGASLSEEISHVARDKPKEKVIRGVFSPQRFIPPGLV